MLRMIVASCLMASQSLWALETDQFMMWGKTLPDSADKVNSWINYETRKILAGINNKRPEKQSCLDVYDKVIKHFSAGPEVITRIETWIYDNPSIAKYPDVAKSKEEVVNETIYKGSVLFKWKIFGVNINSNGIYIGIDKLAHVLETGEDYFKEYLQHRKKGASDDEAEIQAIEKGIFQERTYYGFMISGVFSHADLEANYQGLLFSKKFCSNNAPYVKFQNNRWELVEKIDLRPYVNPHWDESYNVNTYTNGRFKKVLPNLKNYCERRNDSAVVDRFARYDLLVKENRSTRYLKQKVQIDGMRPQENYSLDTICR